MFNSSILRACALLAVGGMVSAAVTHAGLFDRARPKPKPAPASAQVEPTRRAQSPTYDSQAAGTWSTGGTYYSAPTYAAPECYSCGPCPSHPWCDKCAVHQIKCCRKTCDQTYYCPVPPYCYPCYGVNPTCWRRMQECWVCPREETPPPAPRAPRTPPQKVEPPPAAPATPAQPPEPMDEPGTSRTRARPRTTPLVSRPQPPAKTASRSRWTGYADTLPEDDDVLEPPKDTLESLIEAEDEATIRIPSGDDETEAVEMATEDDAESTPVESAEEDAEIEPAAETE